MNVIERVLAATAWATVEAQTKADAAAKAKTKDANSRKRAADGAWMGAVAGLVREVGAGEGFDRKTVTIGVGKARKGEAQRDNHALAERYIALGADKSDAYKMGTLTCWLLSDPTLEVHCIKQDDKGTASFVGWRTAHGAISERLYPKARTAADVLADVGVTCTTEDEDLAKLVLALGHSGVIAALRAYVEDAAE